MTKKDIKNAKLEDLILRLCSCAYGTHYTKRDDQDAQNICAELVERGLVSDDFTEHCMRLMRA